MSLYINKSKDSNREVIDVHARATKYNICINNYQKYPQYNEQYLMHLLKHQLNLLYFCCSKEVSSSGNNTPHMHIFILSGFPMTFSNVQKNFPKAHIEIARGSNKQNREYVGKFGKWKTTEKGDTQDKNSFVEYAVPFQDALLYLQHHNMLDEEQIVPQWQDDFNKRMERIMRYRISKNS